MSWHHSDYIDLFSSIGGVVSAAAAAYAAMLARDAAKSSSSAQEETRKFQILSQLNSEISMLSIRCNNCVGDDSLVLKAINNLVELATACTVARQAIEGAEIDQRERDNLSTTFKRMLRPGVIGEIERADALFDTKGFSDDILRQQYRDIQKFLKVENPVPLPDPIIVNNP